MSLHIWIAFVMAASLLLLIPGPTVLQCISDALANGRSRSWATVLGVGFGDATAMTLSLLGAGALLRASSGAFFVLKSLGGVYLMWLGVKTIWRARRGEVSQQVGQTEQRTASAKRRFFKIGITTMLNPKSLIFFVAFLPQFLVSGKAILPQAAILLATFVLLTMANAWMYIRCASAVGLKLQSRTAQERVGYASGGVLLTAGAFTLGLKRS